jgi:hypothetical protein
VVNPIAAIRLKRILPMIFAIVVSIAIIAAIATIMPNRVPTAVRTGTGLAFNQRTRPSS